MTTIQLQKQKKRKPKDTAKVFEWAIQELRKAEDLLIKRKSQIILETAKKLEDAGIETNKISMEIIRNLKGYVDDQYVREVLNGYPQYKETYRVINAKKRKSSSENRANPAQTEQSQNAEQPRSETQQSMIISEEEEQDEAPTGYYQMPLEDFRIADIEQYDRLFLIRIVRYLYEKLPERSRNNG